MTYVPTESYLHRAAKQLVARWLRDSCAKDVRDRCVDLPPIAARPNRGAPYHGVWIEYPIGRDGAGVHSVWDETHPWCDRDAPPTFETLTASFWPVACVVDIAVCHKGAISDVVEIVHKHPTPQYKRDFLRSLGVDLWEVDAYRVLSQIDMPSALPLWTPGRRRRVRA